MVGAVFAPAGAQIGWLVLAVVLHVCGQVSRGVAWRGVLAASWPHVTRRRVCAWYVCGAGLSGVLSARGGDAVRAALGKRELERATWPALAGTLAAEASFESAFGIGFTLLAVALGIGTLHAPSPALLAAAAVAARGGGGGAPRALDRVVRRVVARSAAASPSCAAALLALPGAALPGPLAHAAPRFGDVLPARLRAAGDARPRPRGSLALGAGAGMPMPGAGPATTGAALLVALPLAAGHPLDHSALASLAVVWPTALTLVGVTLSLVLLAVPVGRADAAGAPARRPRAAHAARTDRSVTAALGLGRARRVLARRRRTARARPRLARPDRGHRARLRRRRAS